MLHSRILIVVFCLGILVGCASAPPLESRLKQSADFAPHLFIFTFDRDGQLVNASELHRAIERLKSGHIKKILVLSFGWANESIEASETYPAYIRGYLRKGAAPADPRELSPDEKQKLQDWMIIGVAWDSSLAGFSRLFADMIPSPLLGNALAMIPDIILFPLSYWSKSSLADRIGFGGLKDALEVLLDQGGAEDNLPNIYAIGHSFGGRVVSGLLQTRQGEVPISETFYYLNRVKGALLIQPAQVSLNLPRGGPHPDPQADSDFPVIVTQSRHDHGNGFLFPIGNLPLNSYTATATEGVFTELLGPCKRRTHLSDTKKGVVDILRIPASTVYTIISTPIAYVWEQVGQIRNRHINYIPDTLAQLPVAEIIVWGIDNGIMRSLGMPQFWGDKHKGALSMGSLNESSARLYSPPLFTTVQAETHSIEAFLKLERVSHNNIYVDVSDAVSEGIFGVSYSNPAMDFTLGWIDPVGSHFKYHNEAVYKIMDRLLTDQITVTTREDDSIVSSTWRAISRCFAHK